MPREVQESMVRTIPGLENCVIKKYAYAIEYDAVNPLDIYPTCKTKKISNLYFAGQINGTSGYEEAACQGLIAGINVGNEILGLDEFILKRDEAYIGVLLDDLVSKGTKEPYRMLTSRAEYRLILRNDNADERLFEYGYLFGLLELEEYNQIKNKYNRVKEGIDYSNNLRFNPSKDINDYLLSVNSTIIKSPTTLSEIIKRPEIDVMEIYNKFFSKYNKEEVESIVINIKYESYIKKSLDEASDLRKYEQFIIPSDIDYSLIDNLASEAREKLIKIKPLSIGQASRIIGVNPVDINIIINYIRENGNK
jgi:tRNA uridine 5-carboxymethylaminomethyl modification enzyme